MYGDVLWRRDKIVLGRAAKKSREAKKFNLFTDSKRTDLLFSLSNEIFAFKTKFFQ